MRAHFTEHDGHHAHGLPAALPEGERILWQGAPRWTLLAAEAYRVRLFTVYFAVIVFARGAYLWSTDGEIGAALLGCVGPAAFSALALALLVGIAYLAARNTTYTVTTRRVVITHGIALSSSVNLPFAAIEAADLKVDAHGRGDVTLVTLRAQRVSYLWMWPHVRPWQITRPQPALRAIDNAAAVATLLHDAFVTALPETRLASNDSATDRTPSIRGRIGAHA